MEQLSLERARSRLWKFPGEKLFEQVAFQQFGLTPEREAALFMGDPRMAMQPLVELLHGRDQILNAYRQLVWNLLREWVPDVEMGVESGAGAGFFFRRIISEEPKLSQRFSHRWIQFEINEQLVKHICSQVPDADVRHGDVYCFRLSPGEATSKKFALAVSSYDVLRFPGRATRNHFSLLNPGEFLILIQDMLPGSESILLAEQVRKYIEGDTAPLEYGTRIRPDGSRDVVTINYRGLSIPTVDYYHNRICDILATTGFDVVAEGYATHDWTGRKQPQHQLAVSSLDLNHFKYDLGCRDYYQDPAIPAGEVIEELRVQVIVARKP